jgi:dolichol-phosphate mannosyltransferase
VFVALDRLGTPVPIAAPAAALVAMVSNFLLHDRWTYRDRRAGPAAGRAVRAVAVQAAGVAIDALVATAVHSWLDAAPVVANLGGIAAAAAWNYALFYRLVWPRTAAAAPAHVIDT